MAAVAISSGKPPRGSTVQQEVQRLKEELAKSQAMASDFLCHLDNLEENMRKYAEQPVVNWSDDCECRIKVSELADILKDFINTQRQARNLNAAGMFPAPSGNRTNRRVSVATQTAGHHTISSSSTQTEEEVHSKHKNCVEMDEANLKIRRLEATNVDLSRLLKKHEMRSILTKEKMENTLEEHRREVQQLEKKFTDENRDLILKNRTLREELSSYNEKQDDLQRAKAQVTAIRWKYYKETGELQCQVNQLREQLRGVNERQPQHMQRTETEHHRSSRAHHHSLSRDQHHRPSRDEHHRTSRTEQCRTSKAEHRRTSRAEHHHEHNQRHVPILRSQAHRLA